MEPREYFLMNGEAVPDGAVGKRVLFAPSRSRLLVGDARLEGAAAMEVDAQFPAVDVLWAPDSARVPLTVAVLLAGELPTVIETQWLFQPPQIERLLFAVDGVEPPSPGPKGSTARPLDIVARELKRGFYEDRLQYIRDIKDPTLRRYHQFFFDLDHATNSDLIPDVVDNPTPASVQIHIHTTTQVLKERVAERMTALGANRSPILGPVDVNALRAISGVQRPIYERHFSTLTPDKDLQEAYEMFASGELYRESDDPGDWNVGPNSAMILLFAEFAIACIEARDPKRPLRSGVDAHFWALALPTLVMIQEIYIAATSNSATRPTFGTSAALDPDRVSPTLLEKLRTKYNSATFETLADAHAANSAALLS